VLVLFGTRWLKLGVARAPELHPDPENATPEELRMAMEAAPNKRSYVRLASISDILVVSATAGGRAALT